MKNILKRTLTSAAITALLVSPLAQATNGYFKIGYGSKNRGVAGAGMAFGQDMLAPAVNPATLVDVFGGADDRVDVGVELFKPKRKGEVDATGIGGALSDEKSRRSTFAIPSFGIGSDLGNKFYIGVSAVANGGLNTRYGDSRADTTPGGGNIYTDAFAPSIPGFIGNLIAAGADPANTVANAGALANNPNITPALGQNLAQLFILPTVAYKFNNNHSIGFSPIIGYQSFRAYGLGLFQAFSSDPGNVTNNGNDDAWGFGAKIGYQGRVGIVSFGASAQSKVYMDEFSDYSGLFAEDGDFDSPPVVGAGLAIQATPKLTIAGDVTRIMYNEVDSLSNDGPTANEFFSAFSAALTNGDPNGQFGTVSNPLGTGDGWGFGWDSVWVYKVGVNYEYNSLWTFRAGYNYAEAPYDDDQALFNILAPAVVEHHVTAGFTYGINPDSELTVTYMHAFREDVDNTYTGSGPFAGFNYSAENDMYQNSIEASYAWKF